jgi:putrescine transport system ATP-binding protein
VGHGITGTLGMAVTVALRPEKIRLRRARPGGEINHVEGTVRDLSYFGSFTLYTLDLANGQRLKVSESNTERHRADAPAAGQTAWATWPDTAQVVLTA